jgi:hypothetical protein
MVSLKAITWAVPLAISAIFIALSSDVMPLRHAQLTTQNVEAFTTVVIQSVQQTRGF